MSKIAFKAITIAATNTLQPMLGTTLSAAITVPVNPTDVATTLTVADTSLFNQSDRVWIDVGANAELCRVVGQPTSATAMKVCRYIQQAGIPVEGPLQKAHANGAIVTLALDCQRVYIQCGGGAASANTGSVFVFYDRNKFGPIPSYGRGSLVAAVSGEVLMVKEMVLTATGVQPIDFSSADDLEVNADNTAYYWIGGTANDTYIPSINVT